MRLVQPKANSESKKETPDYLKRKCFVRWGGDVVELLVDPEAPTLVFMEELAEHTGIPVETQRIFFSGIKKPFAHDKSLRYYGAQGGGFFDLHRMEDLDKDGNVIKKKKERRSSLPSNSSHGDREKEMDTSLQEQTLEAQRARRQGVIDRAEAQRRAKEEEANRRKAEEEAARKAKEDALRKKAEEEAARLKVAADARRAKEEAARKAKEEAERKKAEEEAARLKAEEDARLAEEAQKKAEEEAARKAKEAEERRLAEEVRMAEEARLAEEARRKAEEDAKKKAEEEAARKKAEEEAARKKAEEEARLKAEEDARLSEVARLKAEEEARLKAEEEARLKAAEEARLKAEEEARLKAEEEARLKAEEEERERVEKEAKRKEKEEKKRLKKEKEDKDKETQWPVYQRKEIKHDFDPTPQDLSRFKAWFMVGDQVPFEMTCPIAMDIKGFKEEILKLRNDARFVKKYFEGLEDSSLLKIYAAGSYGEGEPLSDDIPVPRDSSEYKFFSVMR